MEVSTQTVVKTCFAFEQAELKELADELRDLRCFLESKLENVELRDQLRRMPCFVSFHEAVLGWAPES